MGAAGRPSGEGRQTIARHAVVKERHPLLRLLAMCAVALGVVAVSATGVAAYSVASAATAVTNAAVALGEDDVIPPSLGAIEGGVNLLLVGTDSCEGQDLELFPRCAHDDGGERNDVTMLVHISDEPRRVTVVSFPRDMLVPIPSCPDGSGGNYSAMSQQMINVSYMYGGLPCTVLTVEELTGVDIQFAASIRWTGVINMSDAIGGVDVCVAGDISDSHTGLNLTAGNHTLVGAEALQFLRIRHGIGDGSDLGRISNQQQFMSSMVRKLQSESVLANPGVLLNLANTAVNQVTQDQLVLSQSLTNPTLMVQIAMAVKDVEYEDIVFVQYPTVYASGTGASRVFPVTDAAAVLFTALAENKPLTLTGEASQGYGVEVTGEAEKPSATPSASASADGATATPEPTDSASGSSDDSDAADASADDRVDLPSSIAGTTAAQVTCTVPEG
ncbi:LCP family protein [Microbacterium sp. C7(2022)]|uniref:LCP family protein n=1 Tax=Microbacterium sp. C7(2022) TaxID=2992759 RepID=UPI00237BC084|nr:LCP family protein [Microbacterium sp. C7(2022)]MDE0547604.1 LCP family protein [Microbacterium sp. C7(2022)]